MYSMQTAMSAMNMEPVGAEQCARPSLRRVLGMERKYPRALFFDPRDLAVSSYQLRGVNTMRPGTGF